MMDREKQIKSLKILNDSAKLYKADNKRGKLLPSLLNKYEVENVNVFNLIKYGVANTSPEIIYKNDLIQKTMLNKLLIMFALTMMNDDSLNTNALLECVALLKYGLSEEDWYKTVTEIVIPTLIKEGIIEKQLTEGETDE